MKRAFRQDNCLYNQPQTGEYVAEAVDSQPGAKAARLRMLHRMGLDAEDCPAAEAREHMIQRREREQDK
jgi:hypothetical protein